MIVSAAAAGGHRGGKEEAEGVAAGAVAGLLLAAEQEEELAEIRQFEGGGEIWRTSREWLPCLRALRFPPEAAGLAPAPGRLPPRGMSVVPHFWFLVVAGQGKARIAYPFC